MSTLRGRQGEAMAAQYLRKHGYDVIAAGYHSRFGEIDLIARKRKQIVFVEVKLRKNAAFAAAMEAVTLSKQDKLRKTALLWLAENPGDWNARFDVIEIYTDTDELHHIENAFY